jgi:hypothetical protein
MLLPYAVVVPDVPPKLAHFTATAWSELRGPLGIAVVVPLALQGIAATLNESVMDKGECQTANK